MIEVFWRTLEYSYLYKYSLDSLTTVKRLIEKFIEDYNTVMPHSAFKCQTPDEMFFGNASSIEEQISKGRLEAREKRIEFNRALSCDECNLSFNQIYPGHERGEVAELQN
jgi:hypothetical protein